MRFITRSTSEPRKELRAIQKKLPELSDIPWVQVLGWGSVATGALALGFFVGRNLRERYRFKHSTPYDFYSHAGDNGGPVEFGVGV